MGWKRYSHPWFGEIEIEVDDFDPILWTWRKPGGPSRAVMNVRCVTALQNLDGKEVNWSNLIKLRGVGRKTINQIRDAFIMAGRKFVTEEEFLAASSVKRGGIFLPGWDCPKCKCFNGEAKERRRACRACDFGTQVM